MRSNSWRSLPPIVRIRVGALNAHFIRRESCPSCRSSSFLPVCSLDYAAPPIRDYLIRAYAEVGHGVELDYLTGATFTLLECHQCGLIFQAEIPGAKLMEIIYERWIDPQITLARHGESDDLRRYALYAQEILQLIAFFRQPPGRLKFLDFGMGWGKWARMAKAVGCDCAGVELSPSRITYAKANGIAVLSFEEISQYKFDFIITEQVFEHLPHPLDTLRHLQQALKPTGLLKISVPDGSDIKRRLTIMDWGAPKTSKNSLNPVAPLEHINCYNRRVIYKMAALAGLEPRRLPLWIQYAYSTNWGTIRSAGRNLLNPIFQNLMAKGTSVLLGKTVGHEDAMARPD